VSNLDIDLVLAKRIVSFMNNLLQIDRNTIQLLIDCRVPCNKELAEHPTVQVLHSKELNLNFVGLLGVLNGLCGTYDNGLAAVAIMTDNNLIDKFVFTVPEIDDSGQPTGKMKVGV